MKVLSYQRELVESKVRFSVAWGERTVTTILLSRLSDRMEVYDHCLYCTRTDNGSPLTDKEEAELLDFLVHAH